MKESYPYLAGDGREDLTGEGDRVVRGGSFDEQRRLVRCACRNYYRPVLRNGTLGCRVVVVSPSSCF